MLGAYPFRVGDNIRVSVRSSTTTDVTLYIRVRYADGSDDTIEVIITHVAGDRGNVLYYTPDTFKKAGWVEHLTIDTTLNNARGQFYMMVAINREPHHFPISAGYIDVPHVPLGTFEPARHGTGYLHSVSIATDQAGNTDKTYTPVISGAFVKLYGVMWYYHCSGDAADRILNVEIRRPFGSLPTGGTVGMVDSIFKATGPTLSLNQEGGMFLYNPEGGDGFVALNDNGTVTYLDTASAPLPLPLLVPKDNPMSLLFTLTDGQAADKYSVFALIEEWIEPG